MHLGCTIRSDPPSSAALLRVRVSAFNTSTWRAWLALQPIPCTDNGPGRARQTGPGAAPGHFAPTYPFVKKGVGGWGGGSVRALTVLLGSGGPRIHLSRHGALRNVRRKILRSSRRATNVHKPPHPAEQAAQNKTLSGEWKPRYLAALAGEYAQMYRNVYKT